jgi:hypothetical protein
LWLTFKIDIEAMKQQVENAIVESSVEGHIDLNDLTNKLLDLIIVSKRQLLNDMLMNQEEVISSPIRFNGVSIEKLKQIFEKNGVKYESPF